VELNQSVKTLSDRANEDMRHVAAIFTSISIQPKVELSSGSELRKLRARAVITS